jgi:hypothetical protein
MILGSELADTKSQNLQIQNLIPDTSGFKSWILCQGQVSWRDTGYSVLTTCSISTPWFDKLACKMFQIHGFLKHYVEMSRKAIPSGNMLGILSLQITSGLNFLSGNVKLSLAFNPLFRSIMQSHFTSAAWNGCNPRRHCCNHLVFILLQIDFFPMLLKIKFKNSHNLLTIVFGYSEWKWYIGGFFHGRWICSSYIVHQLQAQSSKLSMCYAYCYIQAASMLLVSPLSMAAETELLTGTYALQAYQGCLLPGHMKKKITLFCVFFRRRIHCSYGATKFSRYCNSCLW